MMAATDLRSQLVMLRTHVRRRDVRAAEELLGALIAETASNGHTPALSPLRRASKDTCAYGWKYTAKGTRTRNRKHVCTGVCSWSGEEALAWLRDTPYKIAPGVEILARLIPIPACAKCDRSRSDHWEAVSDEDGRLQGFRAIEECQYEHEG